MSLNAPHITMNTICETLFTSVINRKAVPTFLLVLCRVPESIATAISCGEERQHVERVSARAPVESDHRLSVIVMPGHAFVPLQLRSIAVPTSLSFNI